VLILGVLIIVTAAAGWLMPALRHLDEIVPDAITGDEPATVSASAREDRG
jgi:hypothetical protein